MCPSTVSAKETIFYPEDDFTQTEIPESNTFNSPLDEKYNYEVPATTDIVETQLEENKQLSEDIGDSDNPNSMIRNQENHNLVTFSIAGSWIQEGGRWWYRHSNGTYTKNNWERINGKWYFFDSSGWMWIGWLSLNGYWYYLDIYNGDMKTGWQHINGSWYYFNESGRMHIGWLNPDGNWYYLKSGGQMCANSWITLSGIEYNFNSSGQWCGTKLKVTRRKQQKSNWCWLGSSEMVGKYKNPSSTFTQSSVSNYALGIIPAIWKELNLPGLHNNVKMAIRKFGGSKITTVGGGNYTRYSLHTIQTMIDGNNPMIMYIRWNASLNFHAVVISGYQNDQLYVIDPWGDSTNVYIDYNNSINNVASFATGLGKYFGSLTINQ